MSNVDILHTLLYYYILYILNQYYYYYYYVSEVSTGAMSTIQVVHTSAQNVSEITMFTRNVYNTIVHSTSAAPSRPSAIYYWSSKTINAVNVFQFSVSCIVLIYIILKVRIHAISSYHTITV